MAPRPETLRMLKIGLLRIKFIWGASKVIQARWWFGLWGFYEHAKGYRNSGLVISIRGLLILTFILAVIAYVAAGTALFLWLDRKPHNYVTFTDALLYPVRAQVISEKRGQAYLDEGIDDLKAQRWSDAEMKLRIGLNRYPYAMRARLALAEFYLVTQRRTQALNLLQDGLAAANGYPGRRYLTVYFLQASAGEDYQRIVAAVDYYFAKQEELPAKERLWLAQQKISALLAEKQAAQVLELLAELPADPALNEQRVMALLQLNRVADAEKYLADWAKASGATAQILRLQVRAYREAGKSEEMEAALEALRLQSPTDSSAYAYKIVQRSMLGNAAGAQAALDDYFLRFGAQSRSMFALAQPLAEIEAVDLLQRYIDKLAEQGHDRRSALLMLAQAYLKQGQWAQATTTLARIKAIGGQPLAGLEFTELLAAVLSNPAEGPQIQLLDQLNRQAFPLRNFRTIIESLRRAQRDEVALAVINCAERFYPGNPTLADYRTAVRRAIDDQRPAVTAISATGSNSAGSILKEREFFPRVEEAIKAQRWAEAAAALRDVQIAKPSWLESRQADVLDRQMFVAQRLSEPLEMVLAAKLLVAGPAPQVQRVLDFANTLHDEKDTNDAILLLREVLRKIPNHGTARRLLEEWDKRPEVILKSLPATETPLRELPAKEAKSPVPAEKAPEAE